NHAVEIFFSNRKSRPSVSGKFALVIFNATKLNMEKVNWKVEGMTCTNCALTVNKYLQSQGMQNVKVNFIGGDVSF
ncbi:heavy-metal-associated domain-containing protein, partial [Roseateles chitinivorans]|uniref:heavy-metal-associated domain-containing protein n=1 Tax=Roseateles chitinivorans TaxID=2917965 RepID=UPI001E3CC6A3